MNGKTEKWVAVIDPYSSGNVLPQKAREKGMKVVRIQSGTDSELHPLDIADIRISANFEDRKIVFTGDIQSTVHELEKFDLMAVIPGYEGVVDTAETIASELSLPTNSRELIQARIDKYEMHNAVGKSGLAIPRQNVFADKKAACRWIENESPGFPLIVKPAQSAGTEGVSLCHDLLELDVAFAKTLGKTNILKKQNSRLLVQEYIRGTEFVVDAISVHGRHFITDVWQYRKNVVNNNNIIYDYAELLDPSCPSLMPLIEYQNGVLDAVGIRYGASHGEVFRTNDGRIVIGEVGARLPGADLPLALERATGIDIAGLNIDSYINPQKAIIELEQLFMSRNKPKHCRVVFPVSEKNGIIKRVRTDLLHEMHSLVHFVLPQAGDLVSKTVDLVTAPGHLVLVHENMDTLKKDYEYFRKIESQLLII